jgi:cephalosporin hydroxylase
MSETKSLQEKNQVKNHRGFWQKVRLRIVRNPALRTPYLTNEERFKDFRFQLDQAGAADKYQDFIACQSPDDFFKFSTQNFGPHQIKQEITGFLAFAAQSSPQTVCEIGTAKGGTTFLLGQSLPSVTHMLGVDLLVNNKSKLRYFTKPSQQITLIDASSYDPATVDRVKQILSGKPIDLLFIDGDHTYDGVKKDFLLYRHFVKPGGIIAFHDIMPDYMTRYGQNTGRWAGDVPQFWQRIKAFYPNHEFVEDYNQDGLGIGAIVYDPDVQIPEDAL